MNAITTCFLFACGCALASGTFAQQGPDDVEALKRYAGSYATDCSKPAGTRLQVSVKALTVVTGSKSVSSANPMAASSYFGRSPPKDYEIALLGRPATGKELDFIVMSDKQGSYINVTSDKELDAMFGKAALAGKFRRCP